MSDAPVRNAESLDVRRPFTRRQALEAGITAKQLRGPRFRRLFTGVYLGADVPLLPSHRVHAALLIHPPTAFASHSSAARLLGAPLPAGLADEHVSVWQAGDRRCREGIRCHVAAPAARVVQLRGLRLSAPAQLFLELADQLTLVDLVVVGDYLVRRGWVTPEEIVAHCAGHPAASRAAAYVRREVDSPMETRLRMLIVLAGLPEPKVNVEVFHEDGRLRYRFDLAWPELRLAVEYDGRQHRDDLDQWDHDVERDEWMDEAAWVRVPVFSRGVYRRPDRTLERVLKALRRRGCRDLPRRLSDDWRVHFPVIG